MSEQHSQTPWYGMTEGKYSTDHAWNASTEDGTNSGFAPIFSGHTVVALAVDSSNGWLTDDVIDANARRIVACVNFCEGISNADIERLKGVENGLARVIDRAKEFKQQRDELLAALKEINALPAHPMRKKGSIIASLAIAKAESC